MKARQVIPQSMKGEGGAALTEFAITLPVFLLLLSGLLTLGQLGYASLQAKSQAYEEMWTHSIYLTTEDRAAMTPRSKLNNAPEQIVNQVVGSAMGNLIDGIPLWSPENQIPGASAGDGANAAIGLRGHWGEAEHYAESAALITGGRIDHHALNPRLARIDPDQNTVQIIGPSNSKARMALDDNLMTNTALEGFNLVDLILDGGIGDFLLGTLGDLYYDGMSAAGFVPGLMAGVRYGRGVGVGESEVYLSNLLFQKPVQYQSVFMTSPAPYTEGAFNSEKMHWFFHVGANQPITNQRTLLNIISQDLETSDQENPRRYSGNVGAGSGGGGGGGR